MPANDEVGPSVAVQVSYGLAPGIHRTLRVDHSAQESILGSRRVPGLGQNGKQRDYESPRDRRSYDSDTES